MSIQRSNTEARAGAPAGSRLGPFKRVTTGQLFVLPALLVYSLFFIYPFLVSIYYSLSSWNGASTERRFVGLANYQRLATDPILWESLLHNMIWIVLGTISPIAIGLLLGVLLWSGAKGTTFFRTIYFLPFILPEVVIAIIWNWIYHPLWGPLNRLLRATGLGFMAKGWLGDPVWALPALIGAAIWSYFGFAFVVIMAGLQDVSKDLVEAAMIDGASAWQRFTNVIVPELRHVLTVITAITLIGGFKVFDIIFATTRGGPGTATQVIATYTYRKAFQDGAVGYGAALSLVMTVLTLIVSYLFIRLRERNG
jgi:ABC-type sugar transport system permease subunit